MQNKMRLILFGSNGVWGQWKLDFGLKINLSIRELKKFRSNKSHPIIKAVILKVFLVEEHFKSNKNILVHFVHKFNNVVDRDNNLLSPLWVGMLKGHLWSHDHLRNPFSCTFISVLWMIKMFLFLLFWTVKTDP